MSNNKRREGWIQSDICTKDNGRILGYTEDEIRVNFRNHNIGGKKDENGNPIDDPTKHDEAGIEMEEMDF